MSSNKSTRFDILMGSIKNNKLFSVLIVIGAVIIAIASFTDALAKLSEYFDKDEPPPPPPVLVSISDRFERLTAYSSQATFSITNNSERLLVITSVKLEPESIRLDNYKIDKIDKRTNRLEPANHTIDLDKIVYNENTWINFPIDETIKPGEHKTIRIKLQVKKVRADILYKLTYKLHLREHNKTLYARVYKYLLPN